MLSSHKTLGSICNTKKESKKSTLARLGSEEGILAFWRTCEHMFCFLWSSGTMILNSQKGYVLTNLPELK